MGEPNSGRRTRAVGTRGHVVTYLAANGGITDPKGMAATALAEAIGYPGSSAAFAQLLSGMERTGLIEREIRGKRTYRIVATPAALQARQGGPPGQARPAGRAGRPAAADGAGRDIGRDLAAASAVPGFDYDELARRLLVQLVRRLAVPAADRLPPGPGEGTASARPVQADPVGPDPGPADSGPGDPGADDAGLRQAVASLEQKLASAQSRQRKLTAENARLRQQLQAAQQSLAQAEERAGSGHLAGQLGSAEVLLLERLLSASRGQAAQQEDEAGAG
jgi:hypothetical protein